MRYRYIQVLTISSNQCFQPIIWPVTMFLGSALAISLFYPVLAFSQQLPKPVIFGLVCFMITLVSEISVMLTYGSMTIKYSENILKTVSHWRNDLWSRKFFRGCSNIAISVNSFHKMDKERPFAFIRFVLQRTVLLVMKTKTSQSYYTFCISLTELACQSD